MPKVKFTIAICNKNMDDTLESSLLSVLKQIDSRFEVLVVDDASSDQSRRILLRLKEQYPALRVLFLEPQVERKLGSTRNFSIRESFGDWIIFHVDTDDLIHPGITKFAEQVIELDDIAGRGLLYAGQQIHMAKKCFLLERGPFANIYRGEDRELYERLSRDEEIIFINHSRFIERMKRKRSKVIRKRVIDEVDQVSNDIRKSMSLKKYWIDLSLQRKNLSNRSLLLRWFVSLLTFRKALKKGPIGVFQKSHKYDFFSQYRSANTHTFEEWMKIFTNKKLA